MKVHELSFTNISRNLMKVWELKYSNEAVRKLEYNIGKWECMWYTIVNISNIRIQWYDLKPPDFENKKDESERKEETFNFTKFKIFFYIVACFEVQL